MSMLVSDLPESKMKLGGLLCLIGGLLGTIINLLIFLYSYPIVQVRYAEKNMLDELQIVPGSFPNMNDVGIIAGILFLVAAYGYYNRKSWSFSLSMIAATTGLLGGWMCFLFPLMASEAPLFLSIFIPNLIIWLLLVIKVRPTVRKIWILGLLAGMALVLNFMNGIEVIKMLANESTAGMPILLVVQKLNWIAAIGFGVASLGFIFDYKWAVPVAIGGGLLAILAGTPLAFTAEEIDPLFLFGPILSAILLLYFLAKGNKVWTNLNTSKAVKG